MTEIKRRTVARKVAPLPGWINDKANREEWHGRFIRLLDRKYRNLDSTISAILDNDDLAQICGVKIRSYVDKSVTIYLYQGRKAREAKHKKQLEIAIAGMNAAVGLYTERGNQAEATYLGALAIELSGELGRCKQAYATKRHGRDRSHLALYECHLFLESRLGRPVTYVTLATLLDAGYEAEGIPPKKTITEDHIRKNLAAFRRNNPLSSNEIDRRMVVPPSHPATK
jgi:hypothetical protein